MSIFGTSGRMRPLFHGSRKTPQKKIEAPKRELPQHGESYNPPEEFLWDKDEKAAMDELDDSEKPQNYVP